MTAEKDKNSLPLPKHEKEMNSATGPVCSKRDTLRLEEAQGLTEVPASPGLCWRQRNAAGVAKTLGRG